ncbi:hypothetical protein A3Q56_01868 [Intoshia linei]|uniref:L-aminoadipate-semialdehyde dehydrogenase-phosphopantetheinyl transferase n=1 Tax=Intoshia linei TaxID=1819745 RepID=A0A177B7X9_9BILA|nr:hypothetical protein A3Q56_01868 [Intoshia linei]
MLMKLKIYYLWLNKLKISKSFLLKCVCQISVEEFTEIRKQIFSANYLQSLFGRLLIRYSLAKEKFNWQSQLSRQDNGKPFIVNEHFFFNLAHQHNMVGVAGSNETNIGIDIVSLSERIPVNIEDYIKSMSKVNHPAEIDFINNSANQLHCFLRIWALKESYAKMVGIGICTDLSKIQFMINEKLQNFVTSTKLKINDIDIDCYFSEFLIDEHILTVCTTNKCQHIIKNINQDELLKLMPCETSVKPECNIWNEYLNKKTK